MSSRIINPRAVEADGEIEPVGPSSAVMPNYQPLRRAQPLVEPVQVGRAPPNGERGVSQHDGVVEVIARLFAEDCFCLSSLEQVGQPIVHASAALAQLTGYQQSELIGRNLGFLMRNDTDQGAELTLRQAVASGESVTVVMRTYKADGSLFWSEQRHYPVNDAAGTATHLLTILRDVSDQVHNEGAQALSSQVSDSLSGDGRFFSYALLLHDDGRDELAWASEGWQSLTGYDVNEVLNYGTASFAYKDDQHLLAERSKGLRQSERRVDQYRLVAQGGQIVWVEDFATRSWRSDEAGITAVYGMIKDVSNAKRGAAEMWRVAHVDALTHLWINSLYGSIR